MIKIAVLLSLYVLLSTVALAESIYPISTSNVRLNVEDDKDMELIINKLFNEQSASDIFDKVKNSKFSIRLINDYNFQDANSEDLSKINDDIGRTHGYKISFIKNIAPMIGEGEYFISINYDSDLYTNSTDPVAFQENYRDMITYRSDGIASADQYFKEENLFKIMVGKMKSRDAYYWKAGVGFHEINAEDTDRGILISGLAQQTAHHEYLNSDGPSRREYISISQPGVSRKSIALEGEIGRDFTLNEDHNSRTWSRLGVNSRISGIENSSFAGTFIKFGYDYNESKSNIPALRVMAGLNARKYSDSSTYTESFIEAGIHGEYVGVNFRYVTPLTKDPGYTNALPEDFIDRGAHIPPKEPMIWLSIEGKIK
jgi:hypothetical protein